MTARIALLRGVNVGGKHRLPMKELVQLMQANGYQNVATYIQSGNVIYQRPSGPAPELADLIEQGFGFRPAIFDFSAAELRRARQRSPFAPEVGKHLHLFFLDRKPATVDDELLEELRAATEEYRLVATVFYLHAPDGIGRSKLVAKLHKALPDVDMTARNLNTIDKLLALVDER